MEDVLTGRSLFTGEEIRWNRKQELGAGTFGAVNQYETDTGDVAVKTASRDTILDHSLIREAAIMMALQNISGTQNVERLVDVIRVGNNIALVFPLAIANLRKYTRTKLDDNTKRVVGLQLAHAIAFIQSRDVLHGDYKPDNILVYEKDPINVAVADFEKGSKIPSRST